MAGLMTYVRAAFNARPAGMFVAPNWIGVGGALLLGLLSPGFLLLGAGLELGYLYMLAMNPRFRRYVDTRQTAQSRQQWQDRLDGQIALLSPDDQRMYRELAGRCAAILAQQSDEGAPAGMAASSPGQAGLQAQGQGLSRLLWIFLRLLLTRQSIQRVIAEASGRGRDTLEERVAALKKRLDSETLSDELRKSLSGQTDILQQRLEGQQQARQKLAFLNAELTRIQEQVELIREQAVLTTDPQTVSQRIDQIAQTLGGTTQWIREQQQIYGQVEDLLTEPPPIVAASTESPAQTPPPIRRGPAAQKEKA